MVTRKRRGHGENLYYQVGLREHLGTEQDPRGLHESADRMLERVDFERLLIKTPILVNDNNHYNFNRTNREILFCLCRGNAQHMRATSVLVWCKCGGWPLLSGA